jgi:hypothetical protein
VIVMARRHVAAVVAAAAVLLLVAAMPTPAGGAVLARDTTVVRGYPRCGVDGVPHGWVWYEGDTPRGVTSAPFLELDNAVFPATSSDCTGAGECLARQPRLAGRMATIIGSGGDDRLNGTPGPDLIVGRSGNDELRGLEGRDVAGPAVTSCAAGRAQTTSPVTPGATSSSPDRAATRWTAATTST